VDREEAKRILESYRLGGKDSHDPMFSDALRELERDPELKAWFEEKEKFDALMVEKLAGAVSAPRPLKHEILDHRPETVRNIFAVRWVWRALAAAAAVVLGLGVWQHFAAPRNPARNLALQAISYTNEMPALQFVCFDASAVAGWANRQPAVRKAALEITKPGTKMDMKLIGSSVVDWNGKPVLMLCLQNGKQMAMVYLVRGDDFQLRPNSSETIEKDGWVSKVSYSKDKAWVLTTKGTPPDLNFEVPF
jgi:hypothetical protein